MYKEQEGSGAGERMTERTMRKEDTVKLISAEGFEFVIDRKAALVSNTLKNMLTSSGKRIVLMSYRSGGLFMT